MEQLNAVYENYLETARPGQRVPGANASPDLRAIRRELPDLFTDQINQGGRAAQNYKVYGSVGQINFHHARIPWVGIFRREITTSAEHGYYIVLLFREDMNGCYLSLNQGYTQFKNAYGIDNLAARQVSLAANRLLDFIDVPPGFIEGRIDLGATRGLGIGYQNGAVVSKYYRREDAVDEAGFRGDLETLIEIYERLFRRVGRNVLDVLNPLNEDDFQEAATALARRQGRGKIQIPPPGPVAPPIRGNGRARSGYRRNVAVSAIAIAQAGFRCEHNRDHITFLSEANHENFVEAHHLVPMQFQTDFEVSLDVPENVVALCPTCHRLLHHGRMREKSPVIRMLHNLRRDALAGRGVEVTENMLLEFYRAKAIDD